MVRWAVITVALYLLLVVALTWPVTVAAFGDWDGEHDSQFGPADMEPAELYDSGWYWFVVAVLVLADALMLVVPVKAASIAFHNCHTSKM